MAQTVSRYKPTPRCSHVAVGIWNKLHVWGGDSGFNKESEELASKVELFDILTGIWEKETTFGTPQPGLRSSAYTTIGTFLYSFSGFDGTSTYRSLYQLNTESWEWKKLVARNPSSAPIRRTASKMVALDEERLLVFAGYTASEYTNELHVFKIPDGG